MGSMMKAASGELELMERIKTLHEELDDLTAQLETAKEQINQLNSQSQALLSKVGNFSYGEVFRSTTKTGKSEFTLYNWSRSYIVTINTAQNTVAIYFLTRYGERNFVVTEIKSVSGVIVTATESKLNIEYANYYDVVIFKMW